MTKEQKWMHKKVYKEDMEESVEGGKIKREKYNGNDREDKLH